MHKYKRAVGFRAYDDHKKLQDLLTQTIIMSDRHAVTKNKENHMLGEFSKDFADGLGITVCGEFDSDEKFTYEYYYHYCSLI